MYAKILHSIFGVRIVLRVVRFKDSFMQVFQDNFVNVSTQSLIPLRNAEIIVVEIIRQFDFSGRGSERIPLIKLWYR